MARLSESSNKTGTMTNQSEEFFQYDEYWLKKGRSIIDNTISTLEKRIKNLNTFLNYLVAGTFFGGVSFSTYVESTNLAVYILITIPLIFIVIAKYKVGVKGGNIISESVDMRSPTQINKEYNDTLQKLTAKVREATLAVAVATGFSLVCLPFAVFFHNKEKSNTIDGEYFVVQYDSKILKVSGNEPKMKNLNVVLFGKTPNNKERTPIQREVLIENPTNFSSSFDLENLMIKLDSVEIHYILDEQEVKSTYRYTINKPPIKSKATKNKVQVKDSTNTNS